MLSCVYIKQVQCTGPNIYTIIKIKLKLYDLPFCKSSNYRVADSSTAIPLQEILFVFTCSCEPGLFLNTIDR